MPMQIPQNLSGPLSSDQIESIRNAASGLSAEQLTWVSGYLAGLAGGGAASGQPLDVAVGASAQSTITVLYGSQTGNAGGIASNLHTQLLQAGHHAELHSLADYNPRQLKKESHVALVVSTHGEGDPPDDAMAFHEFIFSKKAPKLDGLSYSVLALGDSSYEQFCQTGKELDERFAELGARRAHDRIDCDVDYQGGAKQWLELWGTEADKIKPEQSGARPKLSVVSAAPVYSKFEPYTAQVLDSFRMTGRDSVKVVNHVEISLEDSGLSYQPGDALGIWPENSVALVDEVLATTGLDGDTVVQIDGDDISLRDALIGKRELTQVHPGLVEFLADSNDDLTVLVAGERRELLDFIHRRQVVELLRMAPREWRPQELVDQLRGITPRLYSIASSEETVGEEVHLTVGLVADERDGAVRYGAASHFLEELNDESTVRVYIEHNRNFKLPENGDTAVIMIGPGTGIAPFRGFMQEREASGAEGRNWLFFGNPHFRSDFLYQTDWQAWHKSGLLSRIDLAFSRDQAEKIYVQDRMREQAADLFAWLEEGAHLYVCGDQNRMAKAVDDELLRIVSEQSGKGDEFANEYVAQLKRDGRYQRDVY